MKSVLLLALAAQLPFAAMSSGPFAGPRVPAAASPVVVSSPSQVSADEERLRQFLANTKSVMKHRGEAAGTGRNLPDDANRSATGISDDQIVRANFNQPQNGASQGANGDALRTDAADAAANQAADVPNANGSLRFESVIDDATRSAANASATLLANGLAMPAENALAGRPVSLAEALGGGPNPSQRLEVASLYWKLALALADFHWALDESLQLGALPGNQGAVDSPLLASAQAAAQARTLEAKAAAVTVQQELADAIGQAMQPLPLTVEQPLVGPYRTEFDSIFANRAAPGRSRAIHRALPHWREAIELRTAAVQAAASAVAPAEEAFFGEQKGSIQTVLFAHRELVQQRRAFLNAVRAYNAEIVEYASYVAGPTTSTATLVGMLTRSKPVKSSSISTPSTFAGSGEPTVAPPEDPNVRPAAAEEAAADDEWQRADESAAQQPM